MKIDDRLIEQLAETAAIELDPGEVIAQRIELEQMAAFVSEKYDEMDTEGMPEMVLPFAIECPLREDAVTNGDMTEELISGAPDRKGPYIRVPRTVEE